MPATSSRPTRKTRADELLRMLKRGPILNHIITSDPYTPAKASREVKAWLDTWITPLVQDLVPELKGRKL